MRVHSEKDEVAVWFGCTTWLHLISAFSRGTSTATIHSEAPNQNLPELLGGGSNQHTHLVEFHFKLADQSSGMKDSDWPHESSLCINDALKAHMTPSSWCPRGKFFFGGVNKIPQLSPTSTPVTVSWRSRSERRRAVVHSMFSAVSAHPSRYVSPLQLFPFASALQPVFRCHPFGLSWSDRKQRVSR